MMTRKKRHYVNRRCSYCGEDIIGGETFYSERQEQLRAFYHTPCFYATRRMGKMLYQLKGGTQQ